MLEIKYDDEVAFRSSQKRSLYYQFDRIRSDCQTKKPDPAVMVISKQTYWTAGGGDEDGMFTSEKKSRREPNRLVKCRQGPVMVSATYRHNDESDAEVMSEILLRPTSMRVNVYNSI